MFRLFFQAQEWVNRVACNGRNVIAISQHKTATFALTQEEDAVSSLPAKFNYHLGFNMMTCILFTAK